MVSYNHMVKLAKEHGLTLVCKYRYELHDDAGLLFWAYYLTDIENYLRSFVNV